MKIGFIGLGHMGRGMALNLLKHGRDLTVYARRSEVLGEFAALGAATTTNLADMAAVELLFLCVPNEKVLRSMLLGESGLLRAMGPEQIVVDCSTIPYLEEKVIAAEAERCGVPFLDAPVSGLEQRALDGTLTFMCGGERAVYERVAPLLYDMGTTVTYMGPTGAGQLTKMINNVIYDINTAAVSELFAAGARLGLDPETLANVINTSSGRSFASEFFLPRTLRGEFGGTYSLSSAYKEMRACAQTCAEDCIPVPVMSAALDVFQRSILRGFGECSKNAMIRPYEELLGIEVRSEN